MHSDVFGKLNTFVSFKNVSKLCTVPMLINDTFVSYSVRWEVPL